MPLRLDDLRGNPGANKTKKRLGRGHGSGRGKTAGRGTKGQNSRAGGGVRWGFEGGQLPIQKRLPYKRGFTNIFKTEWEVVNLASFANLPADEPVTPQVLLAHGLIRDLDHPVKILGDGDVNGPFLVQAHAFSASAKERIAAAGGTTEELERLDKWAQLRPRSRRIPLDRELKAARVGKVGGPSRAEALAARRNGQGS